MTFTETMDLIALCVSTTGSVILIKYLLDEMDDWLDDIRPRYPLSHF